MEEHTIQVAWLEGSKLLLRDEVRLLDELRAARVFRRLADVLKALENAGTHEQGDTP